MNNLKDYLTSTKEFKRYKELANYFKNNTILNEKIELYKSLQKQIVNANYNNDLKKLSDLKKEHKKIEEEIQDIPFASEYFGLMETLFNIFNYISNRISANLDIINIK